MSLAPQRRAYDEGAQDLSRRNAALQVALGTCELPSHANFLRTESPRSVRQRSAPSCFVRRILQWFALCLAAAVVTGWLALGANRGWTKTSVTRWQKDPVTEIEGPIVEK